MSSAFFTFSMHPKFTSLIVFFFNINTFTLSFTFYAIHSVYHFITYKKNKIIYKISFNSFLNSLSDTDKLNPN